jgi:hypothetical protein
MVKSGNHSKKHNRSLRARNSGFTKPLPAVRLAEGPGGLSSRLTSYYNTTSALFYGENTSSNGIFASANITFARANITFAHANITFANANITFANANTTFAHANTTFAKTNITFAHANTTFAKANSLPAKPKIMNCFRKTYKNKVLFINN